MAFIRLSSHPVRSSVSGSSPSQLGHADMERILRITGAILTILAACGGGLVVAFFSIMTARHARVDSEVGVTVYGLQMIFALEATIVCTFLCSSLWWAGIRRARVSGNVKRWEKIVHALFFYPSTLLSAVILGFLAYRIAVAGA